MDSTKPKQIRVYLRPEEVQALNDLMEATGMKDTAILSLLATAALRAAKDAHYNIPLALKFKVVEPVPGGRYELNEPEKPHNVARHSFVSYHLAHFKNAALTALEAGHSEAMLFKHYRAMVTPAQAGEFWAILPG